MEFHQSSTRVPSEYYRYSIGTHREYYDFGKTIKTL